MLYLPPYAPDLNLIGEAFSKVTRLLHEAEAHSRKASSDAMGTTISAVVIGTPAASSSIGGVVPSSAIVISATAAVCCTGSPSIS